MIRYDYNKQRFRTIAKKVKAQHFDCCIVGSNPPSPVHYLIFAPSILSCIVFGKMANLLLLVCRHGFESHYGFCILFEIQFYEPPFMLMYCYWQSSNNLKIIVLLGSNPNALIQTLAFAPSILSCIVFGKTLISLLRDWKHGFESHYGFYFFKKSRFKYLQIKNILILYNSVKTNGPLAQLVRASGS